MQDELQPQRYFDMYNNVFKTLKQRVIWKTRKEKIIGLPKNVITVKWTPQQEILGKWKICKYSFDYSAYTFFLISAENCNNVAICKKDDINEL